MVEADKKQFKVMMTASMAIYNQEVDIDVLRIWWNSLEKFNIDIISKAFSRHIQDPKVGKFAPKPADIIGIIDFMNPSGRIGVEEAWSLFPKDENVSAVITDEMAEAMQSAYPLIHEGDYIGARMAFKEAYARIVENNKFNGVQPKWFPSLGHNKEGRESAVKLAVEKGRITQENANALLPAPLDGKLLDNILMLKDSMAKDTALTGEQKKNNHERMQKIRELLLKQG